MGGSQQSGFSSWPTSPDRPDSSSLGPPPLRPWTPGDDPILHLSDDLVLFLEANNQKNAQDPRFAGLRNDALKEQKLMEEKFEKARGASQREQAQSLREEANRHKDRRDHLNNKAAEWLYKENNKDLPSDTIDLHGLYVKEALTYAEKFIEKAQKKGRPDRLNFIVGRGLHSVNSKPQVKPAIEELVRKHQLAFEIHPRNPGIIVVHLNVPGHQLDRGVNLLDRILCNPNPKDGCVII
ncbi:hypothetical protein PGT21_017061 [Puccinia graminis f. sp. tritici]|uniref:Smr domain-containing protein n=1 Tax=Puccinia graminis f. sp. tritici TaxID=56615 RepID=A0A5B0PK70_PUCGR|nr:hypothetical protein PGT21_017061 [Puccinia graminis f. sp. tritici]